MLFFGAGKQCFNRNIRFAPVVTRSKAVDLQKKQTSRSVFQCYVFGPPGVGKVRLLPTLNQVKRQ